VRIARAAVLAMLAACAPAPQPAPPLHNAASPDDPAHPPPGRLCRPPAPARLRPGSPAVGAIGGTVVDHRCEPVAGATLVVRTHRGTARVRITDEDGGFAIDDLPPGEYGISVYYLDATLDRGGVRIRAGAVERVQLTMPPPLKAEPRITHDRP